MTKNMRTSSVALLLFAVAPVARAADPYVYDCTNWCKSGVWLACNDVCTISESGGRWDVLCDLSPDWGVGGEVHALSAGDGGTGWIFVWGDDFGCFITDLEEDDEFAGLMIFGTDQNDHIELQGTTALGPYSGTLTDPMGVLGDGFYGYVNGFDGDDYILGSYEDAGTNGIGSCTGGTGSYTTYQDQLDGGGDDDEIDGDDGWDYLKGGTQNDFVEGGYGTDLICGGSGDDTLEGNQDADYIYGEDGTNTIRGGDGADNLTGGAYLDYVYGGEGDDIMRGGLTADRMLGAQGNDYMYGEGGADQMNGQDGNDVMDGGSEADLVCGGGSLSVGYDTLKGGSGADTLYQLAGYNTPTGTDTSGGAKCGAYGYGNFTGACTSYFTRLEAAPWCPTY